VYLPRPRPVHVALETTRAKQKAEAERATLARKRMRATVQVARFARKRGMGASVANEVVARKWKEVGSRLKLTAGGVTRWAACATHSLLGLFRCEAGHSSVSSEKLLHAIPDIPAQLSHAHGA
jgi:hypothetical protein